MPPFLEIWADLVSIGNCRARVYQPDELALRFEKVRVLGFGGEGVVYQVEDHKEKALRALKIATGNCAVDVRAHEIKGVIEEILDSEASPHLTRVYEWVSVNVRVFTELETTRPGFFKPLTGREGAIFFPRRACVMECLDGDVESLHGKVTLSKDSLLILKVQVISIQFLLGTRGLFPTESYKWRNVMYKRLGPEDLFRGRRMIDFPYWKYVFGDQELYIPRPDYLVKLGDVDPWTLGDPPKECPIALLSRPLPRHGMTLEGLSARFARPQDTSIPILEVFDSNKV